MQRTYLLFIIIFISGLRFGITAQVAINTDGSTAEASAMLDISSTSKGILVPRMTLSQRDAITNPVTGLMVYQSDNTPGFYFYNGSTWVVIGYGATTINSLYDGKTDSYSLFLGTGSGSADDGTNNRNTAVGINAYVSSVDGYANTAFGNEALNKNTTGTHNAAIGTQSLTNNLIGTGNTAIGTNAGFSVTGSRNVLIGNNVAFNETDISDKLFIENSASSTPLIYGEFDNDLVRINGTLNINSSFQLPTVDGLNDQVLKTNGSGTLAWSNDVGASKIDDLNDGISDSSSVFLGYNSGNSDDGNNLNVGVGINSMENVAGGIENTGIGNSALNSITSGHHNLAIGTNALSALVTGYDNTAVGVNAGSITTGIKNVFIGANAGTNETGSYKLYISNTSSSTPLIYGEFNNDLLRINGTLDVNNEYQFPTVDGTSNQVLKTNGSGVLSWSDESGVTSINELTDGKAVGYSVFLGNNAGFADDGTDNWNTSIGDSSFYTNTSGSYNTSLGGMCQYLNSSGNMNLALGYKALYSNTTGSGNIAIGAEAGYSETGSNKLYIENSNSGSPLIYGEFDNDMIKINGALELANSTSASSIKFYEPSGSGTNFTMLTVQAQSADITYTLPASDGNNGQILQTNGSGDLSWADNVTSYSIGDFAHGGIVFWLDESGQHGLVCTKHDQSSAIQWYNGSYIYTQSSGDGIGSGEMNTILIIAAQGYNSNDYAAGICADLTVTENSVNYGDWYLPSLTELTEIYNNRVIINATAAANGGSALSSTGSYWTSVELTNGHAYIKKFHDGGYSSTLKNYTNHVRAVRKF